MAGRQQWADQDPDEEEMVAIQDQPNYSSQKKQNEGWDLEDQYEQGEYDYYEQDDNEEFTLCLQQIDCMNPPIKINLENIAYNANEEEVVHFCLQKCQDKGAVIECQLYKERGRPTGNGHIMVKSREAAKDVIWMWGESLFERNIQMYLDETYDGSVASEEDVGFNKPQPVQQHQQYQKAQQQQQDQAKKEQYVSKFTNSNKQQQSGSQVQQQKQTQQETTQEEHKVKKAEIQQSQQEAQEQSKGQKPQQQKQESQNEASLRTQQNDFQGEWPKDPQQFTSSRARIAQSRGQHKIQETHVITQKEPQVQQQAAPVQQKKQQAVPEPKKVIVPTAPAWSNPEEASAILSQPKVKQEQWGIPQAVAPQTGNRLTAAQMKLLEKKKLEEKERQKKAEEIKKQESLKKSGKERTSTYRRARRAGRAGRGRGFVRGRGGHQNRNQEGTQQQGEVQPQTNEQQVQEQTQQEWGTQENQQSSWGPQENQQQEWGTQENQQQPTQQEGRGRRGGRGAGRGGRYTENKDQQQKEGQQQVKKNPENFQGNRGNRGNAGRGRRNAQQNYTYQPKNTTQEQGSN